MARNGIDQSEKAVAELRRQMHGKVISRGDDGYDDARKVWNRAVDHRPAAIAFCERMEDIQAAVATARLHQLPVSVRAVGHDTAGRAVRPDGLVIDLSRLNSVQVEDQTAIVAGGATAANVIAAASAGNLVPVTGWHGMPGMTGLVTGGGYGPSIASHGLAADHLLGAELVLADGRHVTANQDENPDLLWALKGGGGNFGVITSMKLRLHPSRPLLGGMMLFALNEAETVLARYAEIIRRASNELSVVIGMISLPDGNPALFLAPAWSGDLGEGQVVLEGLQRIGTPVHAHIAATTYQALLQGFDARVANGMHHALQTRWIPKLDQEAISILAAAGAKRTSPFSTIILHHFRGAATQIAPQGTAFGLRREHILVEIIASWAPVAGEDGSRHRGWAQALWQDLAQMALPGGYPNLLGPDARDQIDRAYGDNLARLQAVKRKFDPDNFFSATPLPV